MINEDHLPKKIKSLNDLAISGRRWVRITSPRLQLKGGGFVCALDDLRKLSVWHMTSISDSRIAWRMVYDFDGHKTSRGGSGQDDSVFLVEEEWYVLYDNCVFA